MKIIVESGATKSDWRVIDNDGRQVARFVLPGMNVSSMKLDDVESVLSKGLLAVGAYSAATAAAQPAGIDYATTAVQSGSAPAPTAAASATTAQPAAQPAGSAPAPTAQPAAPVPAKPVGGSGAVEAFYLYTAGVVTEELRERLRAKLEPVCGHVEIENDLVGAARSLFGKKSGIAAILGTGSNTCFYDGRTVSQKVLSGGFIIGDDGSASALGKVFLSDYIKNLIPEPVAREFAAEFDASYAGIVAGVYKSQSPAGYLGSLAPFIIRHYDDPYIKAMVDGNFNRFIQRSLLAYDTDSYPVGVVGGFGYACRDIFGSLCEKAGIKVETFSPEPIEGLIKFIA